MIFMFFYVSFDLSSGTSSHISHQVAQHNNTHNKDANSSLWGQWTFINQNYNNRILKNKNHFHLNTFYKLVWDFIWNAPCIVFNHFNVHLPFVLILEYILTSLPRVGHFGVLDKVASHLGLFIFYTLVIFLCKHF
jgi:hypothetical protein